ncbi:MAG: hypothetical protein ACTSPM_08290 [Candidatus Heimdallarchaeota archaeon]
MKSKTRTILSLVILLSISTQFLTYSIGESVDPIEKSYTLPAQSWYFILEDENLTANTVFSFEWSSDIEIQGTPVSETDYSAMQAMNLLERSNYFESLAYIEGKIDTGKVTANQNGEIFFVFFNADTVQANLFEFKIRIKCGFSVTSCNWFDFSSCGNNFSQHNSLRDN